MAAELKTDLELTRVQTREPDRLEYLAALGLVILNAGAFKIPDEGKVLLKTLHVDGAVERSGSGWRSTGAGKTCGSKSTRFRSREATCC